MIEMLDYKEVTVNGQTFMEPLLEVEEQIEIGKFGHKALDYLEENEPQKVALLKMEGVLFKTLAEINEITL